MKSITIYLSDTMDGTDPKAEFQGKKIFASSYCNEHRIGLMIVRPVGEGVYVECVLALLTQMAREIADQANIPEDEVM
jgi:hypothetical protein